MRKLNKKQKKILDMEAMRSIISVDDIENSIWKELEGLNDYETLWSDANRYLWDNMNTINHKKIRGFV